MTGHDDRGVRGAVLDALGGDRATFRERAADVLDGPVPSVAAFEAADPGVDTADLLERERRLVWRVWALDDAPLGVTLSGAAYEDNPIRYANARFRELTGYPLAELVGENPRLLQGPDTESAAVARLHEALRGWEPATVELWNYRKDGERFRNRVSLLPVSDETGTVTHWFGVQERVDNG
jgi:PAS domain S-box-containing protein